MTDTVDDPLIVVGQIAGAFGVRGEARVRSFTAVPEACFDYGPLVDSSGAVVITPMRVRPINDGFGVTPDETVQREHWEALKGTLLHVRRSVLPETDDTDEIYVADLVGCAVAHVDGRELGEVKAVHDFGAGDLVEIATSGAGAFLLPFTHENFPQVDVAARRLVAAPDEALLPDALQRQASDGGTN